MRFSLHRFEEFGKLRPAELGALRALAGERRGYRRLQRIRGDNVVPTGFFVLLDGWVASSHTVANGGRQILKVHLPGDALGTPSMCMARTVEELTALTDATVVDVPFARFARVFEDHPRIAARFLLSAQLERVALMDQLALMGRTPADARLAAFLIDLVERLDPLGLVENDGFVMKLTQEQLADVLGLTPVHTNRTIRAFEKRELISRQGQRLALLQRDVLARLAGRPARERVTDPGWLPQPR